MELRLNDLRPAKGANKDRKRVGRGHGSGHVKTAGKGMKGQKARSGGNVPPRFEGGQTPIQQQLPYKRGFTNIWKTQYHIINLEQLSNIESDSEFTPELLKQLGLLRDTDRPLKILANGEITKAIRISAHKVSESARQKIEAKGGVVTIIETGEQHKRSRGQSQAPVRARDARAK